MECYDKETASVVCLFVSRKRQLRTKSLTHNLRGPEMVPVLFATCVTENNTYTHPPHTHILFISVFLSDPMWFTVKHINIIKQITALLFWLKESLNTFLILQDILCLISLFLHLLFFRHHPLTAKTHPVYIFL